MESSIPDPHDHRHLHIPFAKRWDYHRDTIRKLYIDEDLSIKDLAAKMKNKYSFDAK